MTREQAIDEAVRCVLARNMDPAFYKVFLRAWDDGIGPNGRALKAIRDEYRRIMGGTQVKMGKPTPYGLKVDSIYAALKQARLNGWTFERIGRAVADSNSYDGKELGALVAHFRHIISESA